MKKLKLILEYDGTAYQGWQIQKTGLTIQGILEEKIEKITGSQSSVVGASRTDAGVHALGQVAVFRTKTSLSTERIKRAMNALLPKDICILDVSEVDDSFHPRHDARRKKYSYTILNQKRSSVFLNKYVWEVKQPLEIQPMVEASEFLIGKQEFSSFQGTGSDTRNQVREIFFLKIERVEEMDFMFAHVGGKFIKIQIEADGFLRHMARNIVGTLVEIGRGRIEPHLMKEILESRDRRLAGPTAPAHGLFLEKIEY